MAYKQRMVDSTTSVRDASREAPAVASPAPTLPLALLVVYAAIWTALAIAPWHRQDWLLENLVVAIAVPVLVLGYRRLRFSNASYVAIFAFLVLHAIGAHYTYAEVPYDRWVQQAAGLSIDALFGFERNHYDRAVHFLYGLLVTPAAVELLAWAASPRGPWRWLLPLTFMMSHSVAYELVEWAAAIMFGGDLGVAYLGTQGDVWDAQKDMLLACLGCVIALMSIAARRHRPGAVPGSQPPPPGH